MASLCDSTNMAVLNLIVHQQTLCIQYPNAFIILYDIEVLGPFSTLREAYREAFQQYEIGTFIVKYCGDLIAGTKQIC